MGDESKRTKAQEVREEQERREQHNREAADQQRQDEITDERARLDKETRAAADLLERRWLETVREAAKRDGVRFIVIAKVVMDPRGSRGSIVDGLVDAIKAEGFTVEHGWPLYASAGVDGRHGGRTTIEEDYEGIVFHGTVPGWKAARPPCFVSAPGGEVAWLLVGW